jgi:hypothetical protein
LTLRIHQAGPSIPGPVNPKPNDLHSKKNPPKRRVFLPERRG